MLQLVEIICKYTLSIFYFITTDGIVSIYTKVPTLYLVTYFIIHDPFIAKVQVNFAIFAIFANGELTRVCRLRLALEMQSSASLHAPVCVRACVHVCVVRVCVRKFACNSTYPHLDSHIPNTYRALHTILVFFVIVRN